MLASGSSLAFAQDTAPSHQAPPSQKSANASSQASPKLSLQEKLRQAERALHQAQNDQDAQHAWDRAEILRQHTLNGSTRMMLSDALDQAQQGTIEAAEHTLSSALTLQPDNALLHRQRAAIRLIGDDPTGAVEDIGLSLNSDPGDPVAWTLLAKAQEALHHNDLALHAFEEVVNCAPHSANIDEQLKHYQQLAHGRED